jgi:large subunit ribosomal protein L35Ae
MKGTVINYRTGRHTQNPHQMLIRPEGVEDRAGAEKLAGKKVVWKSPAGKELTGTITSPHGNKGMVRARFERGLPGQAVGTEVEIK